MNGSRRLVRLPDLSFHFTIDPRCGTGSVPESVLISVADTHSELPMETLADDDQAHADLDVPGAQLAPIAVDDFCPLDGSGRTSLVVAGALTAQVSVHCSSGDDKTVHFHSQPLDIRLICGASGTGDWGLSR